MLNIKNIKISDYLYKLSEEKIAKFPLKDRADSKLLVYREGKITENVFRNISDEITEKSLMILNNTKVINARFLFKKPSGAEIEIFCLEPLEGMQNIETVFTKKENSSWKCFVGNAAKWKTGKLSIKSDSFVLTANILERGKDLFIINFSWDNKNITWGDVLNEAGIIPLPPYLNRVPIEADKERYQTVFAKNRGSVAAPTSALHFTDKITKKLIQKNVLLEYITLHIGAGTFKPVSTELLIEHKMHSETFFINKGVVRKLYDQLQSQYPSVISVGTTSMRTLESLYWIGAVTLKNKSLFVPQWLPYENKTSCSVLKSLENILTFMEKNNLEVLEGKTEIILLPGYDFKITNGLLTNFHQPGSTLLLLIAAFIGKDWKYVYEFALNNNFRFLSYGDSSILLKL